MTIGDRIRDERTRLGLSQADFADIAGAHRKGQGNYESGERSPDADYLAAIAAAGADVLYILTGDRSFVPPQDVLSGDERVLIDGFRALDGATKKRVLAAVFGGEPPAARSQRFVFHGEVKGGVTNIEGDYTQNGPLNIGGKGRKK